MRRGFPRPARCGHGKRRPHSGKRWDRWKSPRENLKETPLSEVLGLASGSRGSDSNTRGPRGFRLGFLGPEQRVNEQGQGGGSRGRSADPAYAPPPFRAPTQTGSARISRGVSGREGGMRGHLAAPSIQGSGGAQWLEGRPQLPVLEKKPPPGGPAVGGGHPGG